MGQFKTFLNYVSQPTYLGYIDKIINYTNDDNKDILVRCCGFRKIDYYNESYKLRE